MLFFWGGARIRAWGWGGGLGLGWGFRDGVGVSGWGGGLGVGWVVLIIFVVLIKYHDKNKTPQKHQRHTHVSKQTCKTYAKRNTKELPPKMSLLHIENYQNFIKSIKTIVKHTQK